MAGEEQFRIVFICTGNRVRSCLAEAHVRQLVADLPVEVSSAGTLDLGPMPALEEAIEVARAGGIDLSAHRARPLRQADLGEADLVIGFERNHVAEAVVEGNADPTKTFSLKELLRLLDGAVPVHPEDPVAAARSLVALAAERRAEMGFVPGEDIADPYGASKSYFNELGTTIDELSRKLVRALFERSW